MNTDLSGQKALVTGASSGIGAAVAEAFAAAGAQVAVHARTLEKTKDTVTRIQDAGGSAFGVEADLNNIAAVEKMCGQAIRDLSGIDIVMNNAGIFEPHPVIQMAVEHWEKTLSVNLTVPFVVAKLTLPTMLKQARGGRQLFTSSISAKVAEAESSAYCASKAGLHALMRSMALEYGQQGITVNAICPGWVDTPMARREHQSNLPAGQNFDEHYQQSMSNNMLGDIIEPVDIANMALFLASDAGRYVTGQAINVCAGLSPTL